MYPWFTVQYMKKKGYKEGMYQIVSRNIYCVPLVYCLVHEEERVQGRYVPDSAHA